MMQPPSALQRLSLDDFDFGYFDYDRPRHLTNAHLTGLLTPDTFTVLPPLPPPTPSPPPAPRTYRFGSPTRRQRKASFVILTSPTPQLPGSASSTRHPSPPGPRKLPPPGKSKIPRSQPTSREPSPTRKRSLNQPRRASMSVAKGPGQSRSKPTSPKIARKASVKRTSVTSKDGKNGEHPSPSRIPRPPAAKGRKSPAPSRDQSPTRKNSRGPPLKKGPTPVAKQPPVFRKNSNMKPLAGKPPLPPAARGRVSIGSNKANTRPSVDNSKNSRPGAGGGKPGPKSVAENSNKAGGAKPAGSGSNAESSKPAGSSQKIMDTCVTVNPTMASAPATTSAPATSSPGDLAPTSTTTANSGPTTSTSSTPPPPDTTSALVSTTTHPALELAEPAVVAAAGTEGAAEQMKSSSAGTKASDKAAGDAVAGSMESVRSTDSGVTARAASSPHPKKKKDLGDEATSEVEVKGDPDMESLSPNTQQPPSQVDSGSSGLPVAATSSSTEGAAANTTTQASGGGGLLARICPCCSKFSSKLGKSVAGSRVGILGGSKVGTIGGSGAASKVDLEDTSPPPTGKCECLRMILCCSRRGGKCCSCCKKKEVVDDDRRKSVATKSISKKPSRTSSTGVEQPDTRPKLDPSLLEIGSMMRGAIPVLPVPLAWICLICNILVPGFGTLLSGLFCLCFGKPRFQPIDDPAGRMGAFLVNVFVAAAQFFTIIFCLVGWGWSIWWGFIMLRVARKYRKLKAAEAANQQQEGAGLAAPVTQNHDVERGRPAQ